MPGERVQTMAKDAGKTIVECQRDSFAGIALLVRRQTKRGGVKPGLAQFRQLALEQRGADIKPFDPHASRTRAELVIGENGDAAGKKAGKRLQRGVIIWMRARH